MNRRLISFAAKLFVWLIVVAAAQCFASTARVVLPPPALNPGESLYYPSPNPAFGIFAPNFYASAPLPANYSVLLISHDFPYNYNGTKDNSFFGFV